MTQAIADHLAILAPVYHPYRWLAPFLRECLDRFWPNHPPLFFCGLTPEEAEPLLHFPVHDEELPRDWSRFVRAAVTDLEQRGFEKCYLILEEHLPLAPCHAEHLNSTLPTLLDRLNAGYIGLMGWDNRRYSTRAPVLGADAFHFMYLNVPGAPRFHLHPSLWRVETLRDCLDLVLRDPLHTPWRFEKVTEPLDADLPERWKNGCYQICGSALAVEQAGAIHSAGKWLERFFFHKLMALYPMLSRDAGRDWWRLIGFDDFFYSGPYPMFFSGVMAKGGINPLFARHVEKHPRYRELWNSLLSARATSERCP